MPVNLCPSCAHANPITASFCNACGEALAVRCPHCAARNDVTSTRCRACGTALTPGATGLVRLPFPSSDGSGDSGSAATDGALPRLSMQDALWTDDTTVPSPLELTPEAVALTVNLLDLGDPKASPGAQPESPLHPQLVRSDPEPAFPAAVEAEPAAEQATEGIGIAAPKGAAPETAKAAHRAAVRHARLARESPEIGATVGPPDVLVLDDNDAARAQLCSLIEGFGFRAHAARTHAEARAMLATRGFVAVFLDIVLSGTARDAAADLCQRVKQAPAHASGRAAALLIVGSGARPVDRVRASLAGADQFLVKPASRGDVVRALDACGVALPSDPRRV